LRCCADLFLGEWSPPDRSSSGRAWPSRRSWILYAGVVALWLGLRAAALRGRTPEIAFLDNPAASATRVSPDPHRARRDSSTICASSSGPCGSRSTTGTPCAPSSSASSNARVLLFLAIAAAPRSRSPGACAAARLAVALAVGGYALLFAVSSNVLFPIGSIEAERLAYAPSAFACMLAGALLVRLPREVLGLGLAGLAGALGAEVLEREPRVEEREHAVPRAAVEKAGASAKAQLQLGEVLEREGDLDGAARRYEASTAIYPGYGPAWFLQGNALHRLGRTEEAIRAWRSALAADPGPRGRARETSATLCSSSIAATRPWPRRGRSSRPTRCTRSSRSSRSVSRTSAPESEVLAARALLAGSRTALADGDAAQALQDAQSAILSGALPREDRREALLALAEAWRRTGRAAGAQKFSAAAERLTP
jgi:tetratricopeptide (TPR) repeat protein